MQNRFKFRFFEECFNKVIPCDDYDLNEIFNSGKIVMQSTGLKDKNGKLIYEGDIVTDKKSGSVAIIEYNSYTYSLMAHIRGMDDYIPLQDICYLGSEITPFEIIGNIYENPELLEITNKL